MNKFKINQANQGKEEELFDFDELPPDINYHLKESSDNLLINFKKDDEIISKVVSETGLKDYAAKLILQTIYQEIRNEVLNEGIIRIHEFGTFFLSKRKKILFNLSKRKKNIIIQI
jgi:nucleoid DNA-binding protein